MKMMWAFLLLPGLLLAVPGSFAYAADRGIGPAVTGRPGVPVEPPMIPGDRTGVPEQRWACPQKGYIDCMPPVSEKNRPLCRPEYIQWAKEHCPDVKVVY